MRFGWALLFLSLFEIRAFALRFQDLAKEIQTRDLRRLEDLLPLLPQELRKEFVLLESSRCSQKASPASPRAILYGDGGKLLLSFNGDPSLEGYHSLYSIEYDSDAATYEFRQVDFSSYGLVPVVSPPNPAECAQCHQRELRPNWDPFPQWTGAIGGEASLSEKDGKRLEDFAARVRFHPRYSHLRFQENLESMRRGPLGRSSAFGLALSINHFEIERLSAWLMRTQDYSSYRYVILAALSDCGDIPSYIPEIAAMASDLFWQDLHRGTQASLAVAPEIYRRLLSPLAIDVIANLRFLFESRGIPLRTWSGSVDHPYLMASVAQTFFLPIATKLKQRDPALEVVPWDYASLLRHYSRQSFPSLYEAGHLTDMRAFCADLKARSLSAFSATP